MDKLKEFLTIAWAKITGWLLAFASNLWEDYLKEKLHDELQGLITDVVEHIKLFRKTEEYEQKRNEAYDKLFNLIKLPVPLSWFSGAIKNILKSTISKKVDELIEKIDI